MYDKEYFEILQRRSPFQFWIRKYFFIPLRSYLKGTVLDIGCGLGEVANHVQNREKYIGIDVNPYCIQYLQNKSLKSEIGSAYEIPLDNDSVDVAIISHVLEHLDDPKKAIREISRTLKPDGLLIVIVPMLKGFNRDSTHRIFYNKDKLRMFAQENQYTVVSISSFPFDFELPGQFFYFFEYRLIARKAASSLQ